MMHSTGNARSFVRGLLGIPAVVATAAMLGGCEVDSFLFDRSKVGRFEETAITLPILERIDVIERDQGAWANATEVTPDDLIPSDLSYRIDPGDVVTVNVFELVQPGEWSETTRMIDAGGMIRLPVIGDVRAAGLTAQELEDQLERLYSERVVQNADVDIVVERGGGFHYIVDGFLSTPGMFNLSNPDLRLLDALAIAGGVPVTTEYVYVIREVALSEDVKPSYERSGSQPNGTAQPTDPNRPVDIESLIEQLDEEEPVKPGFLRQDGDPVVDIDDVTGTSAPPPTEPADIDLVEPASPGNAPAVDVDDLGGSQQPSGRGATLDAGSDTWVYDRQRQEWVRIRTPGAATAPQPATTSSRRPMTLERIIRVDYQALKNGNTALNIVVRPNDRIYVSGPEIGQVYIMGEVQRPGVYNLPQGQGKLTLARLIAATGGFGPLAVPERVDLTRRIGPNREATIRLNLAAIFQRNEPDVLLKADDHIIVGTDFWATPLAIIRNGFRATYGFGFLLDRNFGEDVFGDTDDNNF